MRPVDVLITALMVFGALVAGTTAVALGFFSFVLLFGEVVMSEREIATNPYYRVIGIFLLVGAVGCGLACGYMVVLNWQRFRDWRRWVAEEPKRSFWDVLKDSDEKRGGEKRRGQK